MYKYVLSFLLCPIFTPLNYKSICTLEGVKRSMEILWTKARYPIQMVVNVVFCVIGRLIQRVAVGRPRK